MTNIIPGLQEQVRIIDGTAQAELDAQRLKILHDMDVRERDRQARQQIVNSMEADGAGGFACVDALKPVERKTNFFSAAIRSELGGKQEDCCFVRELSASIRKERPNIPNRGGVLIPLQVKASGLDTRFNTAGKYLVADKLLDLVTILRNRTAVLRMGGSLLTGLASAVSLPTQTTGSSASFVSENSGSDVGASDSSFGQIALQPRTLQATTSYSRQLLQQSSLDVEMFLREDLGAAHAVAIDAAAIAGPGSANQPLGLLYTPNVPVIALGANGLAPTADALCQMEQSVSDASADLGTLGWVTTPTMRRKLRATPLFTGATVPCWTGNEGNDYLLGSPATVSKSVPQTLVKGSSSDCHMIAVGYWPALIVASWGVMEIVFDPYSQKKKNLWEISTFQTVDIAVRRPNAFALIADARNV